MLIRFPATRIAASMVLAALLPGAALAQNMPEICDSAFARQTLASGNYQIFCDCNTVSTAFIQRIQAANDFTGVVNVTLPRCPGLANLLTETVTATGPSGGPEPDGGGREPGGPGGEPPGPGGEPEGPGGEPEGPGGEPNFNGL